MLKIYRLFFGFSIIFALFSVVFAHGTHCEILQSGIINLKASFDSGLPMMGSDVLIFAPGETEASSKTQTDEQGQFSFLPDRPGIWVLQVRDQGGHGLRMNLNIDDDLQLATNSGDKGRYTLGQKFVMVVSILWGAMGSFLYFKGKK